jgi:hypothetical protein
MTRLLAPPAWAWVVAHYLVAFAVVIALRAIKGVPTRGIEDIAWAAASAVMLSVLTGAGGIMAGVVFRRRPRIVLTCRSASMVLLLLVSTLMMIQA